MVGGYFIIWKAVVMLDCHYTPLKVGKRTAAMGVAQQQSLVVTFRPPHPNLLFPFASSPRFYSY
jgi:hypothetical protein